MSHQCVLPSAKGRTRHCALCHRLLIASISSVHRDGEVHHLWVCEDCGHPNVFGTKAPPLVPCDAVPANTDH